MTAAEFWDSYPCEIEPYFEAEKLRRLQKDEDNYNLYVYFVNALGVTLHNSFSGKNTKKADYIDKPLLSEQRELTESEKQVAVENVFANLFQMQDNFERSKKKE
jgi:hypothetical protein